MKRDVRVVLGIEEVLALRFVVLHAASGIYASSLNLRVEEASRDVGGWKRKSGVPLVEFSGGGYRRLQRKIDHAPFLCTYENRNFFRSK